MIQKGDTLLFKTGQHGQDVGLVLRVYTAGRNTLYFVDNGYGEEQVSPRQVLQVLKAVPRRGGWTSAPVEAFAGDAEEVCAP
ncbi:MAG TPA: hypothetical protein VGX68_20705 [Thermoanaerobaculia bacterium]|jgi:hypothetical protein|nr:hypothetical protein [Thermoanaerobaculia bacterium]